MFAKYDASQYMAKEYPIDDIFMLKRQEESFKSALSITKVKNFLQVYQEFRPIFRHIFSISPFLSQNLIKDIPFWDATCETSAEDIFNTIVQEVDECWRTMDQKHLMKTLRICKNRVATLCGLMDILGAWPVMCVTKRLSVFANHVCHSVLNYCLKKMRQDNILAEIIEENPGIDSGFCILAMGKLGAGELNYSSDIDLVMFFDLDKARAVNTQFLREKVVKYFKNFITILEHKTIDGYVFRTDLRLRPNPSMTPIILTKRAMLQYYESLGSSWERFVMIKATPVAGDIALGKQFLQDITSFVWRKNLDFMALEDIFVIKNKMHPRRPRINIAGYNVKVGVGGIREIEFFAQAHQVIWGGRRFELRDKQTLKTLDKLAVAKFYTVGDMRSLKDAYLYHRTLEHRLQMINDTQTQIIPTQNKGIQTVAKFMNFKEKKDLEEHTMRHVHVVRTLYDGLFEKRHVAKPTIAPTFTVEELPFTDKRKVESIVKIWLGGKYHCLRAEKARNILQLLVGKILKAIAETFNPDDTLIYFDAFLKKLPSGVQLFALFKSYPNLLKILANIMANAPRLSQALVRSSFLLDGLVTNRYREPIPEVSILRDILQRSMIGDRGDFQDTLNTVRRFKADFFFEQGVRILQNIEIPCNVTAGLSLVADVSIQALIKASVDIMVENAGIMQGGSFAVLAFGKLGGREILHRSDADLVCVYKHSDMRQKSLGKRALNPMQYYVGLFQRIVTAISTPMENGRLFETDLQLRPHGNKGALAAHINHFRQYYLQPHAWTWEFMALTRARVLFASDNTIKHDLENIQHNALIQERSVQDLHRDMRAMRSKLKEKFYDGNAFYIKHRPGGLIDIEFICQILQLRHAHLYPEILHSNTRKAYDLLYSKRLLFSEHYAILTEALALWQNIQGIIRLTTPKRFVLKQASCGQISSMLACTNFDRLDHLTAKIEKLAKNVRLLFNFYTK